MRLVRYPLADEDGLLCLIPSNALQPVWERLSREANALGLTLAGWEALNALRIEAGIPWFGIDMDSTNLLPETGLDHAVISETKGCYLGQEIVARMRTYGSASKKLMQLAVMGNDAGTIPEAGEAIVRAGETVGRVTSGCYSPNLQRPLALGYVKRGAYEPGTAVEILRGEQRLPAVISEPPRRSVV